MRIFVIAFEDLYQILEDLNKDLSSFTSNQGAQEYKLEKISVFSNVL